MSAEVAASVALLLSKLLVHVEAVPAETCEHWTVICTWGVWQSKQVQALHSLTDVAGFLLEHL